ncbi:AraC family transcriptional regulator [Bacteroides caecimuris]|uniref:helix-turn-helix domain-containing protein n=1 Tax=Bacteroides caecimuris TaxID=1796613 RepID=UPI002648C710|nr:helix-turn-helix transcriptional regulator [Bacteroides caecimuris]
MIQKNWTGKTADEFNRLMSIPELAKIACMSARNLQLMFKAYTSETIHQYIIRTRMEYVQQLLKDNKKSIAEIYEYIGFANQSALNNTLQKNTISLLKNYKRNYWKPVILILHVFLLTA